jgi:hypothetical protein
MWICLNNSFVSIVQSKEDASKVYVRSRRKFDLKNFLNNKSVEIVETPYRDYRYRALVAKSDLANMLFSFPEKITYGNFKDSVVDKNLSAMYGEVWSSGLHNLDPDWLTRNGYHVR